MQCRAARFFSGNYVRDSDVTEMLETLGWQSLQDRRKEAWLIMLFKVVPGLVVVLPEDHIERANTRNRGKNSLKLKVYTPNTEVFTNSFFPKTFKDWNELSEETVTSATLDIF